MGSIAVEAKMLKLPEPFASIPKENFLFGPSPIQYLPRITKALGGKVGVYAKREDCNSGLAFGGNKVRKLECAAPAPHLREYSNILQTGILALRRWKQAPIHWSASEAFNLTTLVLLRPLQSNSG
jgi:hypothetical protein